MNVTKRNHYNPCFWTALWNGEYYQAAKSSRVHLLSAREQTIHALSVKSGKLLARTVERVHYDKNLGLAEITREVAADFVRRHHPDQYQTFLRDSKGSQYPVFIDFEDILTALEQLPPYQTLMKVALSGSIDSAVEKANVGAFVVLQCLRSHAIMNSMIDWHDEIGYSKFEHFVTLKWMLGDTLALFNLVNPIVCCRWTLYTGASQLPLCDSPILVRPESIMVALSPELLLEIKPSSKAPEDTTPFFQCISEEKIAEYRRRTIGNTFREIIGSQVILEQWKETSEFRARTRLMKDVKNYNAMVSKDGRREIWQLNTYGNAG